MSWIIRNLYIAYFNNKRIWQKRGAICVEGRFTTYWFTLSLRCTNDEV